MHEQTVSRIQRRNTIKNSLQTNFIKLNQFIQTLNQKIKGRIQLVAQVYVEDYKVQVKQMTQEIRQMRAILDQEVLKQRANQRLFFLQEERDFFRSQVVKLNEELTSLNKSNLKYKQSLQQSRAEAKNYKNLVVGLQKKIFKIQSEAFQTEKLKQIPMSSSVPVIQSKQLMSATKPTLDTQFFPGQSLSLRTVHRSVDLKRHRSQKVLDPQLRKKQQILQECIKDVKKKIFYRTLSPEQSQKWHFQQNKKVPFQKFTRTDKQDLIKSILSNQEILDQFYNFMTTSKEQKNNLVQTPINFHKTLTNRIGLTDKVFKIKLCGSNRQLK